MVAQVGALRVAIGADITGLRTGMARAQREVSRGAKGMQKSVSDLQLTFKEVATTAGRSLRVLGGALALGFGVREILNVADASKQLASQLKLATREYGSFAQANKDVRAIAETTRSDLLATSELYAALQRNSGQLGTSQEQVARATKTVAEAFKVSGAATSEQSAATRQLIQAFQSGVLRGDEFNSVMENAPRLARLLADSLGVTVGKLRAMAEAGELTSDKLIKAFTDKRFTAGIDEEFKQMPVTFDQAMGQVYNAAVIVFGAFDSGGQFSTALANFITGGTQGFATLEQSAYQFGATTRGLLDSLDALRAALGSVHTEGIGAFLGLENAAISFRDVLGGVLSTVDAVANGLVNMARLPYNLGRFAAGKSLALDPVSNLRGTFDKSINAANLRRIMGVSARDVLSEFGMGPKPPPFQAPAAKAKKGKAAPRDRSADVEFQFAEEQRRVQMEILQAQQSLSNDYKERARIGLQLLDLQKEDEKAELDNRVRKAERDFAEKKITKSALDQVVAQAAVLKEKNDEVFRLKAQAITDEVRQQQAEDEARLAQVKFDIEHDQLEADSQLADTSAEQLDFALRLLDLSYRQEKARLDTVIADETSSEAAKEEARLRLKALDARYAAERAGAAAQNRSPLQAYKARWSDIGEENEQAIVNGLEDMADALSKVTEGWAAFKDAALGALKSVFQELLKNQFRQLLAGLIPGAGGSGGIGGLLGGISSFFGGSGGGASAGGGFQLAPSISSLWTNVPDFAGGGGFNIRGVPGIDRNVLSMNGLPIANVSYGERLNIDPANDTGNRQVGSRGDTNFYVTTPDADSFRRSQRQIIRETNRRLHR